MLQGNKNNSCMGAYNTLDIKLTDKCNGSCAFCIEKGGRLSKESELNYLINKVNTINPKSVLILGGEPFMYKKLPEFLEGISGREIYITTNGSGLQDSNLVKKISKNLTALNISLMHYGMEKHYEVTNVKLNSDDLKNSISILRENNVNVRINSILLKDYLDNFSDCETMAKYSKSLNANSIRFSEVQDYPELFVDASKIFKGITQNPFFDGCEQKINLVGGIESSVKVTCGFVNPLKSKPVIQNSFSCHGGCHGGPSEETLGVLYPDSFHSKKGWISKKNKDNCHGGCH